MISGKVGQFENLHLHTTIDVGHLNAHLPLYEFFNMYFLIEDA